MPTNIASLTHALRVQLAGAGISLSLGHTHQLVAAAFGYKSLAVLQAANEPNILEPSMHWLVDVAQIHARATSLALSIDAEAFVQALGRASYSCQGPRLFLSDAAMADDFVDEAQDAALHDSSVADQMADANVTGLWEVHLDFAGSTIDASSEIGDSFVIDFEGEVQGDPDLDRGYVGHAVDVTVQVSLVHVGKRLIAGEADVEIVSAMLNDGYYSADYDE